MSNKYDSYALGISDFDILYTILIGMAPLQNNNTRCVYMRVCVDLNRCGLIIPGSLPAIIVVSV